MMGEVYLWNIEHRGFVVDIRQSIQQFDCPFYVEVFDIDYRYPLPQDYVHTVRCEVNELIPHLLIGKNLRLNFQMVDSGGQYISNMTEKRNTAVIQELKKWMEKNSHLDWDSENSSVVINNDEHYIQTLGYPAKRPLNSKYLSYDDPVLAKMSHPDMFIFHDVNLKNIKKMIDAAIP